MTKLSFFLFLLLSLFPENQSLAQAAERPQKVFTGVYLMNLYDISLDEHSYKADFYVWFKWKGDLDPTDIEFVNAVEKWGMTSTPFEDSILTLRDGWNYQGFRVESRFFHPFVLDRFPLEKHHLEIHIEHPDYPVDSLIFLPDTSSSVSLAASKPPGKSVFFRPDLLLAGWNILGADLQQKEHAYGTDFGNPDNPASTFSDLVFTFRLGRPVSYFLLKLLLPLTIVMFAAFGALLFFPSYVEARISLPVGSLLTAVFLQQSYSSALPDVGYMVLMDKIYLLAYLLIAALLLQLIVTGNKIRRFKKEGVDYPRIKRKEKRLAWGFAGVYVVGVLMLVWLA